MERQLVAILYADVAHYSRHTERDEQRTHQHLDESLNYLTDVVSKNGGQKLHEAGDAILAEFRSVTAAVSAATEFQLGMLERNGDVTDDDRFEFRLGVNLGEVIHDRDDIYGEGVNLAARIQELSQPGTFAVSGSVFEQVAGKTALVFDDLGHRKLKNIEQPIRAYQARLIGASDEKEQPSWPYFNESKKDPVATGGCLCGGIRFDAWDEPLMVGYCHCRFCQLATGAPLNAAVVYRPHAVQFHGTPKVYTSSLIAKRAFCGECGTSLYTIHYAPDTGDYCAIRLATMDHPEDFPPTSHYGVESKIPWLDVNDDLPRMRALDDPEMQRRWDAVGCSNPEDQLPRPQKTRKR